MENLDLSNALVFPELTGIASAAMQAMPVNSWWGIKFLDSKFLYAFDSSPAIEVLRVEEGLQIKITGSHELDPALSQRQLNQLAFFGFTPMNVDECDCLVTSFLSDYDALKSFATAVDMLSFVYGVSDDAALYGSNAFLNHELKHIPRSRFCRSVGGFRLFIDRRRRSDLR